MQALQRGRKETSQCRMGSFKSILRKGKLHVEVNILIFDFRACRPHFWSCWNLCVLMFVSRKPLIYEFLWSYLWVPVCVPVYVEAASLCHSAASCEEVCATFARAANWSLLPACWAFRQCTAWHSCKGFDMLWAPMSINEHKSKLHFEVICFSLNILRRESNLRQIHS